MPDGRVLREVDGAGAALVGGARKWRTTNLKKAAMIMATWR